MRALFAIVAVLAAMSPALAGPPKSLSEPLDNNYSNGCNDPGQYAVTDSSGTTACYGSNGQPA